MFRLKRQFRSLLPTSANGALFPAACTLLLAVLAGAQLVLTAPEDLPDAGFGGGGVRVAMPQVPSAVPDPVLRAAPLFSPERTMGAAAEGGEAGPAWRLVGSITVRGRPLAIMQGPNSRVVRLAPGRGIDGMRLLSVNQSGATFLTGGKRVVMAFGSGLAPGLSPDSPSEDEEQ